LIEGKRQSLSEDVGNGQVFKRVPGNVEKTHNRSISG
jgi:hypothetical protein